jgi:DNA polymerase-3 subunit alpha
VINWAPLHQHSHADSLLDAVSKPKQIVEQCKLYGYNSAALTGHGSITSSVEFYKECKENNLKSILGIELYTCKDLKDKSPQTRKLDHLVLLCKNLKGWQSLLKLVYKMNSEDWFYYKPRVDLETLAEYAGNFITFSGHPGSTLFTKLWVADTNPYKAKTYDEAIQCLDVDAIKLGEKWAKYHEDIFGVGNFYIEIQLIDQDRLPCARVAADILRQVSINTGIPCVATADSHYINKEDAELQRILLCSTLHTTLKEVNKKLDNAEEVGLGGFFQSQNYHLPTKAEINELHKDFPHEIEAACKIAAQCENYDILSPPKIPQFQCQDANEELKALCREGWVKKIQGKIPQSQHGIYKDRISKELGVLQEANLSSYFLIVDDIMKYSRGLGYLNGPGRGSVGGCLTAFLTDITDIDSIRYNLIFERFYNVARKGSIPDIDVDLMPESRDGIINYLRTKYGKDNVAQMATYSRLMGRGALKEVLRINSVCNFDVMNKICEFIPDEAKIADELEVIRREGGDPSIIRWALENEEKGLSEWCTLYEGQLYGDYSKWFEQAIKLEGTIKAQSKHASGVVISSQPLYEYCPMVRDKSTNDHIVGLPMEDIESVGGVKFDFLGLNFLSKVKYAEELIRGKVC